MTYWRQRTCIRWQAYAVCSPTDNADVRKIITLRRKNAFPIAGHLWIHRSPEIPLTNSQECGILIVSFLLGSTNCWTNNEAHVTSLWLYSFILCFSYMWSRKRQYKFMWMVYWRLYEYVTSIFIFNFQRHYSTMCSQIAKFMGPTWGPPGSCRPQRVPMLAPWTLLSGFICIWHVCGCRH